MHEISIAENIIETVNEALTRHHKTEIIEVILDIGTLTCIEQDALKTALLSYNNSNGWNGTRFVFNTIPGMAICMKCQKKFEVDEFYAICPYCEHVDIEIIGGKDFIIKSITLE